MSKPRVAIIGSEGRLGVPLRLALESRYEVRRVDMHAPNEPNTMRGDTRAQEDMERAVEECDVVVLLAAYHGGYNPPPTDETRFETNVMGTFRVMQACLKRGVRKVVWGSSTGAVSKLGIYAATKVLGEDLCEYYHLTHGLQVAMMRYGAFTACDLLTYGERMLTCGVDLRDCVDATVSAIDLLQTGASLCASLTIMPDHGLTTDECRSFGKHWRDILAAADPEFPRLIDRYGVDIPESLQQHDLQPAIDYLAFRPKYNFLSFLTELSERDGEGEITPTSPRWCFENGIAPPPDVVQPRSGVRRRRETQ